MQTTSKKCKLSIKINFLSHKVLSTEEERVLAQQSNSFNLISFPEYHEKQKRQ